MLQIFDRSKARERQQRLKVEYLHQVGEVLELNTSAWLEHLQEEASRGYWDDFKELKDSKGKVFSASSSLEPAESSPLIPNSKVKELQSNISIGRSLL